MIPSFIYCTPLLHPERTFGCDNFNISNYSQTHVVIGLLHV